MGKQILETADVELIKHLLHNEQWSTTRVAELITSVHRKQIYRIKVGSRWTDVEAPDPLLGRELFYRFCRKNHLRYE